MLQLQCSGIDWNENCQVAEDKMYSFRIYLQLTNTQNGLILLYQFSAIAPTPMSDKFLSTLPKRCRRKLHTTQILYISVHMIVVVVINIFN